MEIFYTDFSRLLGFDYRDSKPLYLTSPVTVVVSTLNCICFVIPSGYRSDGCTLKFRVFWLLFGCPHTGKYVPASVIHDYVVENPELVNGDLRLSTDIFYFVLLKEGVNGVIANLMRFFVYWYQKIFKKERWNA